MFLDWCLLCLAIQINSFAIPISCLCNVSCVGSTEKENSEKDLVYSVDSYLQQLLDTFTIHHL